MSENQVAQTGVRGEGLGDSGNARKKTFFFIDVFPISETYVGAQREVPRSEGAPVLTVEVTLWVTQNL